jgi:aspartyl-tRNA(Asn)/glutamyl-tRNA(Gln) amidotransferase subunit B
LPVLNSKAVKYALQFADAVGAKANDVLVFDRKNYFYPDLPKGYQITQFFFPLAFGGTIKTSSGIIELEKMHIEEDAAKMKHNRDATLVDFNRSSAPLLEVVTKPTISSAADAAECFRNVRLTAIYLGITNGEMQDGDLRCDANISVSTDKELPAYKVEIKNINSFKVLEKALEFEKQRQIGIIENGSIPISETRTVNEDEGSTISLRHGESKLSYRYMKEPDLPLLKMPAIVSTKFVSPSDKLKSYCSIGLEKNAVEYLRDNFEHSNLFDIIRKEISNLKPNLLFNVLSVSVFKNAKKIENQHCFVDILKLLADEQISKDSCVELLKLSIVDGNFDYKEFAKKNKMIYNNDREYIAQSINKVLHTEDQSQIKIAADPIKNVGKLIKIITLTYPDINPKYISEYLKNDLI